MSFTIDVSSDTRLCFFIYIPLFISKSVATIIFIHWLQHNRRNNNKIHLFSLQCNWNKFPCVLKAGHCHGGKAIALMNIPGALQDAAGLLCGPVLNTQGSYCCIEPYIESKYDILIQKIGSSYKAFMWVEFISQFLCSF